MFENPKSILDPEKEYFGEITWKSPSNIAIVKYWGKYARQLPRNPSISFSLKNACSTTKLKYSPRKRHERKLALNYRFMGKEQTEFALKLEKHLESILEIFPFMEQLQLSFESENNFPHSAGIASSAAAYSSIALCLCSLEHELFNSLDDDREFDKKASYIARLGSGSASRSVFPGWAIWGKQGEVEDSSEEFARDINEKIHDSFKTIRDEILIIDDEEKAVSSTTGHLLMETHPFANERFHQARQQTHELLIALEKGNWQEFGRIAEEEALGLHALMMMSRPSFILLKPNTLQAIETIRAYRKESGKHLYFTLDAGPNLHLIYPSDQSREIGKFIETQLKPFAKNGQIISDEIGPGPVQLA